jgi:hypothetical protein
MGARMEEITFAQFCSFLLWIEGARPAEGGVVEWDEDGSNVRPGPIESRYESVRKDCVVN